MTVELSLREAQRLKGLLENSIANLSIVNDDNYPMRQEDYALVKKLAMSCDSHWNK